MLLITNMVQPTVYKSTVNKYTTQLQKNLQVLGHVEITMLIENIIQLHGG